MKDFFNIKTWQLILLWLLVIYITLITNPDSSDKITLIIPIMLTYTLGWLGYRNSK